MFNYDHPYLFGFRSYYMMVLSRRKIGPSFEDTLLSGTCIQGVSPGEGGASTMA
jgi:hypothetical protein